MSAYKQQEYDFIYRTKEILAQYETISFKSPKDKYEITLFLNCFVGLLILPQQYWFDELPTDLISEKEWGVNPNHISVISGTKNVKDVARHLRNSIAHNRFKVFSNSNDELSQVKFNDRMGENTTFEAVVPLKNLKLFVGKFSDYVMDGMVKSK
jgi:hypothetical protein